MASSSNNDGGGPANGDLLLVGVNRVTMIAPKLAKLVVRFGVPLKYICRLPDPGECVFALGLSEIGVCEGTL